MQVVAGRQVVLDWALAKAKFTDPAMQESGELMLSCCAGSCACLNKLSCCLAYLTAFAHNNIAATCRGSFAAASNKHISHSSA